MNVRVEHGELHIFSFSFLFYFYFYFLNLELEFSITLYDTVLQTGHKSQSHDHVSHRTL